MSRSEFLPSLTDTPNFSTSRASLDKVDLSIGDFLLGGENAALALHDAIRESDLYHNDHQQPMFRALNMMHLSRRVLVETASGSCSRTALVPVFTGKIFGSILRPNHVQFSLSAKLNVTRAIQAQRLMRRLDKPAIGRGPYTLLLERHSPNWQGEYPLVDATNVLIGSDLRYDYAMSRPASAHLINLVTGIERAIVHPLLNAAQRHQADANAVGRYTLREVEVYWEFDTPSPISTVDLLSYKLTAAVNHSRTTAQAIILPVSEIIQQSRSIQLDLGQKMLLRVYAKTNARVRFEVSFGREAISRVNGRRQLAQHAQLANVIDRLVEIASQRLTDLFREASPHAYSALRATTADLLQAIAASHPNSHITALVLDSLRHFRRVAPQGNPELLAAVQALKRRRVLRIIRRQQSWYGMTSKYQSALEGLIAPQG